MAAISGIGGERYWVHIPATKPRAYKTGGLVAAAKAAKGSPMANELGDSELVHVNKYEMEQLREMWGEPAINPETGLPAYGLFKTLGKIAKGVVKAAATVALTPVLGPVGATMAVNAADTAISGGSFKDVVKSAALSGATAAAAELAAGTAKNPFTGKVISNGLPIADKNLARAIGAGVGTFGGQVATGASIDDALMAGAGSGLSTYTTNKFLGDQIGKSGFIGDAYRGLTNIGYDISNVTGIGGGGNYTPSTGNYGDEIKVTAPTGARLTLGAGIGDIGPVTSQTPSNQNFDYKNEGDTAPKQVVDKEGTIIVTATPSTRLTLGGGIPNINTDVPQDILDKAAEEGADITTDDSGEIFVNGTRLTDLTIGATSTTGTTAKEDVGVVPPPGSVVPFYPSPPAATTPSGIVPNLVPSGGRYAEVPLNRGLASINFDPFTYGQAIEGGQPGEFLFFTQDGRPYGGAGGYTGPGSGAGIGGGTETGGGGRLTLDEDTSSGVTPPTAPTTTTTTAPATGYQANLRNPDIAAYKKIIDSSLGSFYQMGQMTEQQLRDYQQKTYDAINAPGATAETVRAAVPVPQYTMFNQPTGTPGKQRYTEAEVESAAAAIPQQMETLTAAPAAGLTAGQYYNQYVAPLAGSYFQSGQLTAEQARGLTNAASPFIRSNDLAGAQAAVAAALASSGLAAPAMKDGGEADDDMVSHLISYHKNGGHNGPGRVKGIGSGQEDKIPAWLSDGEYVWSAQDVADLGDGSTDEGVRRLDKMRQMVRKQAGRKDVKNIAKPQQGIDRMLKAVGGAV